MIIQVFQCSLCERNFSSKEEAEIHEGFCELRAEYVRAEQYSSADVQGLMEQFIQNIGGSDCALYAHEMVTRAQQIKSIMHRLIDKVNDMPAEWRKEGPR